MLDPRQQQKGGFGAFAAREHERQELRDARNAVLGRDAAADGAADGAADATTDAADVTGPGPVSAADGTADEATKR